MRANGTSTYDLLDGVPLASLAKATQFPNLFLVPSKPELAGAAVELSQRDDGERYLAEALQHAEGFDFVLLDCPPSLGPLTVNALAASDRVIVPVQTEYYALEGLAQLVQSINLIKARLNPKLEIAGVLLTMTDGRTRLSADVEAEVRKHFGDARVQRRRAALRARRRGAEPRPARDPLRPALARCRGLLEGGDGACRAFVIAAGRPRPCFPAGCKPAGSCVLGCVRSLRPRTRPASLSPLVFARQWSAFVTGQPARRGLGRGFEVLIGGAAPELAQVAVDQIHPNPNQPRKRFDSDGVTGLAESIKAQGLIQPVVLRPRLEGGYELIAGERRWRAAREAGITAVPAVVREADDRDTLLLGLVENVAREDLSPIEEARAFAVLIDEFGLSLGEVAERVGRSKPTVSNRIRLLELPEDVLSMIARRELTEGHARAVLAVPDQDGRRRLARRIVKEGLSVRAAERAARWAGARTKERRVSAVDPALAARVKDAFRLLTGFEAKVGAAGVHLPVDGDVQLEELAEALERLGAR